MLQIYKSCIVFTHIFRSRKKKQHKMFWEGFYRQAFIFAATVVVVLIAVVIVLSVRLTYYKSAVPMQTGGNTTSLESDEQETEDDYSAEYPALNRGKLKGKKHGNESKVLKGPVTPS